MNTQHQLPRFNSKVSFHIRCKRMCLIPLAAAAAGLLFVFLVVLSALAGAPPLEVVQGFGDPTGNTTSIAVGDLNGDGALDIVVGNFGSPGAPKPSRVYLSDGTGAFSLGSSLGDEDPISSVALGDLDGDGALDIVLGNGWGQNLIYLNDGAGAFSAGTPFGGSDPTGSVALGDLNSDGALDIVVGNGGGQQNLVYLNGGGVPGGTLGTFPSGSPLGTSGYISSTTSVAVGDLDGDGALDVVVGNEWEQNLVYWNDGTGAFSASPLGSSGYLSPTISVAVGDLNGDGALDLVVGNSKQASVVYLNDSGAPGGTMGAFSSAIPFGNLETFEDVALGDLNGDGALDIVVGDDGGQNRIYLNDGAGAFPTGTPFGGLDYTKGVAAGDLDGDGALDLVVGNYGQQNVIYLNDGGLRGTLDVFSGGASFGGWNGTESVALGDVDGDGALDLVVGNNWGQNLVYLNQGDVQGGTLGTFSSANPLGSLGSISRTISVALGDLNGDGALDVVAGNWGERNLVHLNSGAGVFSPGVPFGGLDQTTSVVLGDVDGDGALDIVVGNQEQQNAVYLNDGTGAFSAGIPFGDTDHTYSVALGDLNGDGALDVVVGNYWQQNAVYLNTGAGSFPFGVPFGGSEGTTIVALGDLDGDGTLDIVAGNYGSQNLIYLNDGSGTAFSGTPFGTPDQTQSVALGDLDGDGALDVVASNEGSQSLFYLNDGAGNLSAGSPFGGPDWTHSVALGDLDGNGTLDIVAGNAWQQNAVYHNRSRLPERLANTPPYLVVARPVTTGDAGFYSTPEILAGQNIPITYTLFDPEGDPVGRVAAHYSLDGGGKWSPAVLTNTQTTNLSTSLPEHYVSSNTFPIAISATHSVVSTTMFIPGAKPVSDVDVWLNIAHTQDSDLEVALESPSGTFVELFSGVGGSGDGFIGTVLDDEAALAITSGTAPFTGTYRPEGSLADFDGEMANGVWTLWITDTVPASEDGAILSWGIDLQAGDGTHVLTWDTFASGVFGQSDNVVFRLEAYPQQAHTGITGTYHYTNTTPGPYQWPYAAAATFPFRVRGTQVQVYSGTVAPGNEVAGAMVYRLPGNQSGDAEPLGGVESPFHTDAHGYLQGRGQLEIGDQLVALLPITATDSYTLYHTSAPATLTGIDAYTITAPGVQALAVSSANPLVLFDLDVSLEWDARNDEIFMSQLTFDLQRASEFLYDWTNGQAALGRVTIYHDREHWLEAHVRVYGSNRLRPSAAQGGVVSEVITDPVASSILYVPGQVHMGAVWNRYGDPGGSLGEDWARTLAHELGHYAFFLDDNYLGFDPGGLLIPVDGCPGAMSDPYREDYPYDEFHPSDGWLPACEQTLSHQITGRSDWETIAAFYPQLDGTGANVGPGRLPLAVTQIRQVTPITPATTLEDPTFYLSTGGQPVQPGNSARAFLFQGDWLIDLGRPTLDRVLARGARHGDRLCVYEQGAERLGCETISTGDEQLELVDMPGWQPDVIVSPITSRTIGITVTNVPAGLPLQARLFPVTDPATEAISLTETTNGYAGTLNADEPALEGYVQVWVNEAAPRRETVTDYALGGNPGHLRGSRVGVRGRPGHIRGSRAPAVSADGQVILFDNHLDFEEGEFVTLQAATSIPSPLPWATTVGHAYRLVGSAGAPDLTEASISFSYMGSEVPPGEEAWLRVYFWDGVSWERLPTQLDAYHNHAVARVQGEGVYALMSSLEIPLYTPGWNLISYPVQGTRPITEALQSIEGSYTMVYGYVVTDTVDPWRVYGVGAPPYVNRLDELQFAQVYWISMTEATTWYVRGGSAPMLDAGGLQDVQSMHIPPATYYGSVSGGAGFTPTAGMTVTARVNGNLCGQSQTMEVDGEIVYFIHVSADDSAATAGCGAPGREVVLQVGTSAVTATAAWDNNRLWELPLGSGKQLYLPLVLNGGW